jgi:hypothetical protein
MLGDRRDFSTAQHDTWKSSAGSWKAANGELNPAAVTRMRGAARPIAKLAAVA